MSKKKNKELTLVDIYDIAMVTDSLRELHIMTAQVLPASGLCPLLANCGYDQVEFENVMGPHNGDETLREFFNTELSLAYWASGLTKQNPNRDYAMTPLRQNILLLYAAYLGEL